ncbi:MAG TPA: HNH endonuclease domain-containing protein [Bacillota bacterium]|nr:HNH endonuclease domain-containing protein [Bacillota bacterium]
MTTGSPTNGSMALAAVAARHPEKTFYLGQVFNDTTNSYKLVWFLALLSLLQRDQKAESLPLSDILAEMAVVAWHPVCLFRLSLGSQDKLQHVILDLQAFSHLDADEKPDGVRAFLQNSPQAESQLQWFARYVPTRFLTPWFAETLRALPDGRRDAEIRRLARASQQGPFATPYWLEKDVLRISPSWRCFLLENAAVIRGFAEHSFALYLRTRNPNVPGIVNKLHAPIERQLAEARQFWSVVRSEFNATGRASRFRDIYSNRPIAEKFSIDHFLPWSFVVHDLVWNLTPVEPAINSAKGDTLPDLELYLPRLASLHFEAIGAAKKRPRLLEDYTECFRLNASELVGLSEDGLIERFRGVMVPQAQIAVNQGFQSGWKFCSAAAAVEIPFEATPAPKLAPDQDAVPDNIIELFPDADAQALAAEYLPFYALKVAAGNFLAGTASEPEGWVHARNHGFKHRLTPGMFVTQVVGHSMEPTIKNGSYCVFRTPVEGSRQGRILLVQKGDFTDPETGGSYTVKRYRSTKSVTEDGWQHQRIDLVPDNPDRQRFPVLTFSLKDDADLQVIAEFIQVLTPSPQRSPTD